MSDVTWSPVVFTCTGAITDVLASLAKLIARYRRDFFPGTRLE